jgi:FK506-binding nuclear protein
MAAIDPNEDVGDAPPRATLKIIHDVLDFGDDSDEDEDDLDDENLDDIKAIERRLGLTAGNDDEDEDMEDDEDEDDEDDDDDEEMVNGGPGPSDPEKRRIAKENAILQALEEDAEEDAEEDEGEALTNGLNGKVDKGKGRALLPLDEDDLSEGGMEEYVVCTLDRNMVCSSKL